MYLSPHHHSTPPRPPSPMNNLSEQGTSFFITTLCQSKWRGHPFCQIVCYSESGSIQRDKVSIAGIKRWRELSRILINASVTRQWQLLWPQRLLGKKHIKKSTVPLLTRIHMLLTRVKKYHRIGLSPGMVNVKRKPIEKQKNCCVIFRPFLPTCSGQFIILFPTILPCNTMILLVHSNMCLVI